MWQLRIWQWDQQQCLGNGSREFRWFRPPCPSMRSYGPSTLPKSVPQLKPVQLSNSPWQSLTVPDSPWQSLTVPDSPWHGFHNVWRYWSWKIRLLVLIRHLDPFGIILNVLDMKRKDILNYIQCLKFHLWDLVHQCCSYGIAAQHLWADSEIDTVWGQLNHTKSKLLWGRTSQNFIKFHKIP